MLKLTAAMLLAAVTGCATDADDGDSRVITGNLDPASHITHVVAANADTGERVVVEASGESYRITLPSSDGAWILTLADATKVGAAMRVATRNLSSSPLALRYANPDIDANGVLDALEDHVFALDLVGGYDIDGDQARYAGTAIEAGVPHDMGMNMPSATALFDSAFYPFGDDAMIAPGTVIGAPHIKLGELGDTSRVGLVAAADHEMPRGTYTFAFDNGALTFTDVDVPAPSALAADLPLLHVRPVDAACVSDCAIGGVDVAWRGAARDARIDVVAMLNGTRVTLSANLTDGESSIAWPAMPVVGTGITHSELAYITSSRVCYAAVTYTSDLGVQMTGRVQNPSCF